MNTPPNQREAMRMETISKWREQAYKNASTSFLIWISYLMGYTYILDKGYFSSDFLYYFLLAMTGFTLYSGFIAYRQLSVANAWYENDKTLEREGK